VAVDETECWLLPLRFDTNEPAKAAKTAGCAESASYKLRLLNRRPLKAGNHKDVRAHQAESKPYKKRTTLLRHAARNPSLQVFVDELTRKTTPPP